MKHLYLIMFLWIASACSNNENIETVNSVENKKTEEVEEKQTKHKRPSAFENGKFFDRGESSFLYGGEKEEDHFDISNCQLIYENFHYGIGREVFPALLEPEFMTVEEADSIWADSTRFLVAYSGDEIKAYSVQDLTRHEVVNDVLDGKPIMAAYCILADLGAVYERSYGSDTLTFALSGYTYYEDSVWEGLDGFILWDRETESLWWPLTGRAVSGPLKNVSLLEMDKIHWEDTNWGNIKTSYPNAQVLISGQDYTRPEEWKKIQDVSNIIFTYSSN